jgi:hypothetical protein
MELKITYQMKPHELQIINEALTNYLHDLQAGEGVAVIGNDPAFCQAAVAELLGQIGMQRRMLPGEYVIQQSFLKKE